jgi:phosphoglycerol transferase MdoB-like AlkP superfamily enzyme
LSAATQPSPLDKASPRGRGSPPPDRSIWWLLRHLLTIGLVHVAVLATVYFLLLLGDALFTSYAIVLQDAVFVSYVAQLGWLQRMASDVKAAIAFVVGVSALLQMLLFVWRAMWR